MTQNNFRPDPEKLLSIQEKNNINSGHLRVYLGMCAGVGKTFAMLEAAQCLLKNNVNLMIGIVETHNRKDTVALSINIPEIPRKKIEYRGKFFEELNLESILKIKPNIVLIDELAHSNIPGMQHPKRWQDIEEILNNGIDVWTTLNIQHVESRKDDVESITGIVIHELVPDSILERAEQVELVDLPIPLLIERLKQGNIYQNDKAEQALNNFFKEDKLTALREIALRFTSEIVNKDLQNYTFLNQQNTKWRTKEKLMVAVSHSPHSKGLVRAARRISFAAKTPWIAVNVETGSILEENEKKMLTENISLAKNLGGEIITIVDSDIVTALKRVVFQQNVTQIIIGRPYYSWWKNLFKGKTLLEKLVKETNIDVLVLRQYSLFGKKENKDFLRYFFKFSIDFNKMLIPFIIVILTTIINLIAVKYIGYQSVGFIYLLMVLGISIFTTLIPLLIVSVLSSFLWDFFFIPPFGSLVISENIDIMMCFSYGITAIIAGFLSNRIQHNKKLLIKREEKISILYEITQIIMKSSDLHNCINELIIKLNNYFNTTIKIYKINSISNQDLDLENLVKNEKEIAVINWVFKNNFT